MRKYLISCLVGVSLLLSSNVFAADYFGSKSDFSVYTAGEAIAIGDTVAFSNTTGYVYKADTDTAWRLPVRGLADNAIASGASGVIVQRGILLGQSALTIGENVYVSATAGGITQTPVTAYPQILGYADTALRYIIDIQSYPVVDLGAVSATTGDFSGAVGVDGDLDVNTNKFNVTAASGNTAIAGTLDVAGAVTNASTTEMTGNVTVATNKVIITAANGNTAIAGTLAAVGDFAVNTDKFNVTASSGNTAIAGTLAAVGAVSAPSLTLNSGIYSGLQVINNSTVNFKFNEDFVGVTPLDVTNLWTLSTTEAGGGDATEAQNDGATGTILVTNDAGDNDLDSGQTGELILLTAAKQTWFAVRFKLNEATENDVLLGLCITDTTPLAASDYLYFIKDDGDTNWDFVSSKDTTETEVATVDTADTNWNLFEIYCDGVTSCTPYINSVAGTPITTNINDDEEMAVTFHLQNGEAVAKTIEIDYITAITER